MAASNCLLLDNRFSETAKVIQQPDCKVDPDDPFVFFYTQNFHLPLDVIETTVKPENKVEPTNPSKSIIKQKKKAKNKKNHVKIGTIRGIETLFRNSYRAQLDLIALATTKANMMISINSIIVSVLIVSGGFVLSTKALMTVPTATFLLTCLASMMFAILAARPRREKSRKTLEEFKQGQANLLVFEQFSNLSESEYLDGMHHLLHDNNRIYDSMAAQLYSLGLDADRKFKFIYVSYTVFLIGLAISTALLMFVVSMPSIAPIG